MNDINRTCSGLIFPPSLRNNTVCSYYAVSKAPSPGMLEPRVAETVWDEYKNVNKLISSVKKEFLKAPTRVELFRSTLKEVPLPPELVITRWGTWLIAVNYYAANLDGIREVFKLLDSEDAQSIARAKEALAASELETQLLFIYSIFGALRGKIELLQRQYTLLVEAVESVEEFCKKLTGQKGKKAKYKLEAVLKRNPACWEDIRKIATRLRGEEEGTLRNVKAKPDGKRCSAYEICSCILY